MLPLEVIGLLGLLYVFFMIGTLKALWAKSAARRKATARPKPKAAVETMPKPVKPIA